MFKSKGTLTRLETHGGLDEARTIPSRCITQTSQIDRSPTLKTSNIVIVFCNEY